MRLFNLLEPRQIQHSQILLKRLQEQLMGFDRLKNPERTVLHALATLFGVDSPIEAEQQRIVKQEILPLLIQSENSQMLQLVERLMPECGKFNTASGAHRFYPLAWVTANMMAGRSLFSPEGLQCLPEIMRDHLVREHPLRGREGIAQAQVIPLPQKEIYSWLDIGSAPKTGGGPTLNTLKNVFQHRLQLFGIDVAFPFFELKAGRIRLSPFVNRQGEVKDQSAVNGVTYYNGKRAQFNIAEQQFMIGRRFDFISICFTLHYFGDYLPYERLPFTSLHLVDSQGRDFRAAAVIRTTKRQQEIVDRLLTRLEVGGVLFLNVDSFLPSYTPGLTITEEMERELIAESNMTLFFAVQRRAETEYQIFDNTPIAFCVPERRHAPSGTKKFIAGETSLVKSPFYRHEGIASYNTLSEEQVKNLTFLFSQADLLVGQYCSWKRSYEGRVSAVLAAIRQKRSIYDIFSIYLQNVPECQEKVEILSTVKQLLV
jgi:hypothetical protein